MKVCRTACQPFLSVSLQIFKSDTGAGQRTREARPGEQKGIASACPQFSGLWGLRCFSGSAGEESLHESVPSWVRKAPEKRKAAHSVFLFSMPGLVDDGGKP